MNILHANIDVHSRRLIYKFLEGGVKFISKLQSHCENMTFSDNSRYYRLFQQFTHKVGESSMNSINIFQITQDSSVLVEISYIEDHLMHIFLDNLHHGGKYTAHIASHQAELVKN